MKRILSISLAIALTLSLMLSGSALAQSEKDTVTIAWDQEAKTMDPNDCADSSSFVIMQNIYEGLVYLTDTYQVEPCLAKSWEISEDGLEYTFALRQDVKFQNGEDFTADDVKFSFDRACASSLAQTASSYIDHTEVVDPYTVKVVLKGAYAPMIQLFGSGYLMIANQEAFEAAGEAFVYAPGGAGTGPYAFVSWTSGESIVLKANENYWREKAAIENVRFTFVSDSTTRSLSIETGDANYASIPESYIAQWEGNPDVRTQFVARFVYNYVAINNSSEGPLSNKLVRQAINHCCDNEELLIVSSGMNGGTVTGTPVPPGWVGHDDSLVPYAKDIEKAKALLSEAGYPDGFDCDINVASGFRSAIATALQASLSEIGINATINTMEYSVVLDYCRSGEYDMACIGWSPTITDPDNMLYPTYYTGVSTNYDHYSNANVDALLTEARYEVDAAKRAELYKQISNVLYDECPDVATYFVNRIYGHSTGLECAYSPYARVECYKMRWTA